jgi:hypothetical protein
MAKLGDTLTANTNYVALAADEQRMNVAIINQSTTETIFVEFGGVASTTVTADCWFIPSSGALFLNVGEWPEIKGSVNLKSTGTPAFVVRSNT